MIVAVKLDSCTFFCHNLNLTFPGSYHWAYFLNMQFYVNGYNFLSNNWIILKFIQKILKASS
jgi:hypothetical protein